MDAELLENAFAAASAHNSDQAGDLSAIKAVLRVAIEACAEIASETLNRVEEDAYSDACCAFRDAAGEVERKIRALLD